MTTPKPQPQPQPEKRIERTCWRAPNPHPPHQWRNTDNIHDKQTYWCPGVKGTTMY